ncbi:probable methyltransferase [Tanacetum coccineum]
MTSSASPGPVAIHNKLKIHGVEKCTREVKIPVKGVLVFLLSNTRLNFLEEDPLWVRSILKTAPNLNVGIVNYQTKLEDADKLMKSYRSEPECTELYSGGYYKEAPGRMGAIYSAAVMARNTKKPGVTHVFLHDVDRKVENTYAEEFSCRKNLKKAVRRLWHFEIPPAENVTTENARFC